MYFGRAFVTLIMWASRWAPPNAGTYYKHLIRSTHNNGVNQFRYAS
jgi:hypothetical protein